LFLWHPIIVHFTIALLSIAVITDFLYLLSKKENFWHFATYLLILGTLSSIGAVLSGHQAENSVLLDPQTRTMVDSHALSGEITMWIFITLSTLRFVLIKFKKFEEPVKWVYYIIGLTALAFLFRTGILGGEMVYIHGVGTSDKVKESTQKPSFK
jgi:uncharacterized membrane protein